MVVRDFEFAQGIEVVHQLAGLMVGEMERGHPQRQPGPNRDRLLEKPVEPLGLHLLALPGQNGRREGRIVQVQRADFAPASLDHVAPRTVVELDEPLALDDVVGPLVMRGKLFGDVVAGLTLQEDAHRAEIVVREIEPGHELFDALGRVAPRRLDFLIGPIAPGMRHVGPIPEEQLLQTLLPVRGQLHTDARLVFHAGDVVAAVAAVFADEPLPFRNQIRVVEFRTGVGTHRVGLERQEVRHHGLGFRVGEPEVGHGGIRRIGARIPDPVVQPAGGRLFCDARQIGCEILVLADHAGRVRVVESVAAAAAERVDQGFALLDQLQVHRVDAVGLGVGLQPCGTFLAARLEQIGRDCLGLVLVEEEMRHARVRPEFVRIGDPFDHPGRIGLGRHTPQVGADFLRFPIPLDEVAARTAELHEQLLPAGDVLAEVVPAGHRLNIGMATQAVGFHLFAEQQRMLPELDVAVRDVHAAGRHALPVVAARAPEEFRWVVADDQIELWVRLVRVGLVFEAALVDPDVAGLAPIDPRQRRVEVAAVEFGDDDLRNGRDVRQHQPGHRLHDVVLDPLLKKVPLALHHAQRFLAFEHARPDFGDLVLDPVALGLLGQEHGFPFLGFGLQGVQMRLLVLGGMFELNGVVVLVPGGFDLAAHDAQGVLGIAGADFRGRKVGFQFGQPRAPFPAGHVGLRRLQSRQGFLVSRVVC